MDGEVNVEVGCENTDSSDSFTDKIKYTTRPTCTGTVVIGISGCTNSGKTSLTKKLKENFPSSNSKYFCQDTYFLEPGDERHEYVEEVNHNNWEKISALDMEKMVNEVKEFIKNSRSNKKSSIIFIEGFTIFNYSPLCDLFDKKYFLTLDFDTCQKRRLGRNYIPPDPVGYFEKVVWPMYKVNKKAIECYQDINYCNGADEQSVTLQSILTDILALPQLQN